MSLNLHDFHPRRTAAGAGDPGERATTAEYASQDGVAEETAYASVACAAEEMACALKRLKLRAGPALDSANAGPAPATRSTWTVLTAGETLRISFMACVTHTATFRH